MSTPGPIPHDLPLPLDSDVEVSEGKGGEPRPAHLRLRYVALVFAGGTFGTAARYGVSESVGPFHDFPVATFLVNITGALALGLLLEALTRRGVDGGMRRRLRLTLGTGFLGGFTTYSALALDTDSLIRSGQPALAALYAFGTVALGLIATMIGIIAAARHHRLRVNKVEVAP